MSDSLERATGEKAAAQQMRKFAQEFGVSMKLIKKK
jgi:hypothetical protein